VEAQKQARAKLATANSALAVFPGVGAAYGPLRRTVISFTVKRSNRQSTQKPPVKASCFDPGGRVALCSRKHSANSEAFGVLLCSRPPNRTPSNFIVAITLRVMIANQNRTLIPSLIPTRRKPSGGPAPAGPPVPKPPLRHPSPVLRLPAGRRTAVVRRHP